MKVRINERSLSAKFDKLEAAYERRAKNKLKDIASELAGYAPVDTGAYAESFSVGPKTRSRSSKGRPRNQSVAQYREIAENTMHGDIEALDLGLEFQRVPFRNRAPHAKYIEGVYQVFGIVRDRNR